MPDRLGAGGPRDHDALPHSRPGRAAVPLGPQSSRGLDPGGAAPDLHNRGGTPPPGAPSQGGEVMTRVLVWAILVMSAAVLAWAGHRWAAARADAHIAIRQFALVSVDAREIAGIKAS